MLAFNSGVICAPNQKTFIRLLSANTMQFSFIKFYATTEVNKR